MRTLSRIFQKWKYLGYDQATYRQYRSLLDLSNLKCLRLYSAVIGVSLLLAGVILSILWQDWLRVILSFGIALAMLLVFLRSNSILNGNSDKDGVRANLLILLSSLTLYLSAIYVGTIASEGNLAVIIVWLFLFIQIGFDTSPLQSLLTALPAYVVLLLASRAYKSPFIASYDVLHATFSICVGQFVSFRKSRQALQNTVANDMLKRSNYALYHTSTTDELTGLPNRRQVFERLSAIQSACLESGGCLACVVLDLDDFKCFNDRYGHPAGDDLLRLVGGALLDFSAKRNVTVGRIGGEEFLAVWQEAHPESCGAIAEELRESILALNDTGKIPAGAYVTISAGLCVVDSTNADKAYYYADKALYRAKDDGKNRSYEYEPSLNEFLPLALAPEPVQEPDSAPAAGN